MAEVKIYPSDDAEVKQADPDTNFGSGTTMNIRRYTSITIISFIKFGDLSSIPPGSVINSATLYIYVDTAAAIPDVGTYVCDADWEEGTITWNNRPTLIGSNIHTFDISTTGWKNCSGDMTNTVSGWYKGTENNYGIGFYPATLRDLIGNLRTKEYAGTDYDPYLLVDYTIGGGILNWWFMKEAWQKHNRIFKPKILKPELGYEM